MNTRTTREAAKREMIDRLVLLDDEFSFLSSASSDSSGWGTEGLTAGEVVVVPVPGK